MRSTSFLPSNQHNILTPTPKRAAEEVGLWMRWEGWDAHMPRFGFHARAPRAGWSGCVGRRFDCQARKPQI